MKLNVRQIIERGMYFETDIDYCSSSGYCSGYFGSVQLYDSGITGGSDGGTNEKKKE